MYAVQSSIQKRVPDSVQVDCTVDEKRQHKFATQDQPHDPVHAQDFPRHVDGRDPVPCDIQKTRRPLRNAGRRNDPRCSNALARRGPAKFLRKPIAIRDYEQRDEASCTVPETLDGDRVGRAHHEPLRRGFRRCTRWRSRIPSHARKITGT